jgi:NhaP-type Na+/H+ and K+/H+ antiporter
MDAAHHLVLLAGALGLLSIFVGLFSARFGTPLLLVFLAIGILFGKEGPVGLVFDDFQAAYLIGSVALALLLFEGGLKTKRSMLKVALWPALALATAGVAITAGTVCAMFALLPPPPSPYSPWVVALLIGAIFAPTDAAAVAMMLRRARLALPTRVTAALEVESGLNDPMSVFLTLLLTQQILSPGSFSAEHAAVLFAKEMGGGALLGVSGGYILLLVLRRLGAEIALYPVVALLGSLLLFGATQSVGASGFIAVYLAGVIVGNTEHRAAPPVKHHFESIGWLAQIVLFLMLGLLITPHMILSAPWFVIAATTATLLLVARPIACLTCLLPFGFTLRETAFMSWVGLRGAVPIYLVIIPMLAGITDAKVLFEPTFMVVVISLVVQGWSIAPAARLLGFRGQPTQPVEVLGSPGSGSRCPSKDPRDRVGVHHLKP